MPTAVGRHFGNTGGDTLNTIFLFKSGESDVESGTRIYMLHGLITGT
jgi:hypothetical protein